jgi:hypothetical protein
MNDKLQGIHFDLDYSIETVVNMYKTKPIFEVKKKTKLLS